MMQGKFNIKIAFNDLSILQQGIQQGSHQQEAEQFIKTYKTGAHCNLETDFNLMDVEWVSLDSGNYAIKWG